MWTTTTIHYRVVVAIDEMTMNTPTLTLARRMPKAKIWKDSCKFDFVFIELLKNSINTS